jgi:hypothetical protein
MGAIRRYDSHMRSSSREEIVEVFDALEADLDRAMELSFDALTTPEGLAMLERCEKLRRCLPAVEYPLINQLAAQATNDELGGTLSQALANRLRISRGDASRRIHDAEDLGERRALTGEPLPPLLPATAAAQRNGQIARLADKLTDCLNPDGDFSDDDRARRRGITIGNQGHDGMSPISGNLTPEARATFDAVLAKLAAPGMCNPADAAPCVQDTASEDAAKRDTRSAAQRNHDALVAAGRALLASGDLGQHNGLPASIIVTTTLQELEAGAGRGLTGGGTLLPMKDVIRMASHAHHYLAIFDKGKALALYHTKRLASPAQRIVLYAKDRGCSFPNCEVSGYYCEVHHTDPYARCHTTDVNDLTLACGPQHKIAEQGWTTRKNRNGDTEWIPPAHLDHGQPRTNTFHHPEKLLRDDEADADEP